MAVHLGTDGFYRYLRLNGNFTEADISIYGRWRQHLWSRRRVIAIFGVSSACHRRVIAVFSHKYVYSYWFYTITAPRMNYRCQRSAFFLKKIIFCDFKLCRRIKIGATSLNFYTIGPCTWASSTCTQRAISGQLAVRSASLGPGFWGTGTG